MIEVHTLKTGAGDPAEMADFDSILESNPASTDGELADLIERDGRQRLGRGLTCELRRYAEAIPDLMAKPISLDAAIDISLRSLAQSEGVETPTEEHAECLLRSYPELAGPIRIAAMLGNQLITTARIGNAPESRMAGVLPRWVGAQLDGGRSRYELRREIGRGRSGTVYEAVDHLLSDKAHTALVAVKMIPVDPASAQRQASEATKARRVEHVNVVRVLDRGLTDQTELFLVYELVTGGDLHQRFERAERRMKPTDVVRTIAAVADGVQAAHSAGLVHCDIKPANILMAADGTPRVSDFGIAASAEMASDLEPDGEGRLPVGSLAFAAPEQVLRSSAAVSPLVDVFGLGGVLFYLLTGTLPNGSTFDEVQRTHHPVTGRKIPPSARAIRPEIDARLDRICARALQPRSEKRYSTVAELASDLRAWLERRPIGWMEESAASRARLWMRRSPLAAAMSAACVLAVVSGGFVSGYFARNAEVANTQFAKIDDSRTKVLNGFENLYKQGFQPEPGKKPLTVDELQQGINKLDNAMRSPEFLDGKIRPEAIAPDKPMQAPARQP